MNVALTTSSQRVLILAPQGRDARIAASILQQSGLTAHICNDLHGLTTEIAAGAGIAVVTDDTVHDTDLKPLVGWIKSQPPWSDFPFVLLTQRGGGVERNPNAARQMQALGNVVFLERPFHPMTLVSVVYTALRGRLRQYEARARLEALRASESHARAAEADLRQLNETLEIKVRERTAELVATNRQLVAQIDEREKVESTLRQMQRLEAIGQLTSGVAHDFNNLLTVVLGNIAFLEKSVADDSKLKQRLSHMRLATERGAKLTSQLLAFSRRQRLEPEPFDLNEAVANMHDLLQSTLGGGIAINTVFGAELWPALADPAQIELVVLNLVINARDAMQDRGTVTIETANAKIGHPERPEEPAAGDYVMVAVTDTGSGMTKEVLAMAFEPFFTTKEIGKGSGLGLSQVLGFAKQSGGGMRIQTRVGEIGVYSIARTRVEPFASREIELASTFADQAVIAIENARLLIELKESLQQQTATAEVLKVISQSTFDLPTVLDTLTASVAQLCNADMAAVTRERSDGEGYTHVTNYNFPSDWIDLNTNNRLTPDRGSVVGRVLLDGKAVQVLDVLADAEYTQLDIAQKAGLRTVLGVPLMRRGQPIGVIILARRSIAPFADNQLKLAQTFADQAVIAIENTRLFTEVQARTEDLAESLQQQIATAEVLKVISRSAFDLPTVLDTLIESATRMCDADQGAITREIDGQFFRAASYGYSPELLDFIRKTPVQMDRSSIAGRALVEGRIVQIPDITADPDYTFSPGLDSGDFRTALGVPMLKEGVSIGVLALTRSLVRPFTDKQIELVTTFADQAAIAIENVRLFESVEARTRELAKSLEDLRAAQDRLVQTEKLASLGQLTAGIAHEIKNPLNFVNNFSAISVDLIDELREALTSAPLESNLRSQINEIADMLAGNLDKVIQHGKRADSIVKNMLLHSRQGSAEHRPVEINSLVEESLNLAYHGARADKQDFNITLQRSLDPAAGEVDLFPQEIMRVLLNLISNGFYAAIKRKAEANGGDYEPTLAAATKNRGDSVEISIRDNGIGIPPEVKEKMFNPFFTTKPAGEGTGLGLSLSHDIIVKQHSGTIEVDTKPGEFTEFRIVLPRGAAALAKSRARE